MAENDPDRLESWKEIAGFIDRDERTAMRWAKELGMPVGRFPGGKRGRVYASRQAIAAWKESHSNPEAESPAEIESLAPGTKPAARKFFWMGAAALLSAAVVGLVLISLPGDLLRPKVPARVTFRETGFDVFDGAGYKLWAHDFEKHLDFSIFPYKKRNIELVRIEDFRGDGNREVLVLAPLRNGPNPIDTFKSEVDCFSREGKLLWTYTPDESFQFGEHQLIGPWNILDVFVATHDSRKSIWITAEHYTWGNSFVAQLDPNTGRGTVKFVNTGVIYALNQLTTPRGDFLLAGGFNNEYDSANLAVIDEKKDFAASPQTAGTRHKCLSCPEGSPDFYFTFPRTEINELEKVYEDTLRLVRVNGNEMEITKSETLDPFSVEAIYLFGTESSITPISLRYDSGYDMLHRELSKQGKLDHSLENCPERLHPKPVRMWTPAAGWVDLPIKPAKASD